MNNYIQQLLLIISLLVSFSVFSQELSDRDLELEDAAFHNLEIKNYKEAAELFSQLMSLYPKSYSYNLYYAECLIEQNKDIGEALKFLNRAKKGEYVPELDYYFGRANHLSYNFEEAVNYYQKFAKEIGVKKANSEYFIDREIRMANNGKELIRYISDLTVIENKHIKRSNYYYSYQLNDYGGKLIVKPPDFMSRKDKKSKEKQLMFISDSGYVYYSSFGKKGNGGLDIYMSFKNADGTWGESQKLSSVINTVYDDAYPYLHSDGKTLYFSSKGHNSMGGYDIFKSVFDSVTNKWSEPINMDFPTNTPYDDYLYISDQKEDYAYFTSNRETTGDKISVYKILVDKNPVLKEYNDIEEIIVKSKLNISTQEEINKAKERNKKQKNLLASSNRNISEGKFNYNFEKLKLDDVSSTDYVVNENEKDIKKIENELETTKTNVNKALVYSFNKNKQADEKRKRANDILSQTDLSDEEKQQAEELNNEADKLEQEAILVYNMSTVLDSDVDQKNKDVEKTKQVSASLKNLQDINKSVNELNANRDNLNKGKEKYFDVNKEITKRNTDISDTKKQLALVREKIAKVKSEIENNNETINNLKVSGDANKKSKIEKINANNKALDVQYQELNSQKEIINSTVDKKQIEVAALKEIETEFSKETNADNNVIAEINKDEFAKIVETKGFKLEAKQKQQLADKQQEAENKSLLLAENIDTTNDVVENNNNTEIIKNDISDNTNTNESDSTLNKNEENNNTDLANNNETETPVKTLSIAEKQATNTEVEKLRAEANKNTETVDSLKTLISEKQNLKSTAETDEEKQKIEKEIESLAFVVGIKQKQADRQNKEANALESTYLADNNVIVVKENKSVNNIISTNNQLEELSKVYQKNKMLSDSLLGLSEEKQRLADNEKDEVKRNDLIDEAEELSQLAEIKKNQSYSDADRINAKEKELNEIILASKNELQTDEELPFENKISENSTDEEKYKNELLKKTYYQNKNNDLEQKLKSYKSSLENVNTPEAKADIEKNIAKLNTEIKQNSALAIVAEATAKKYKKNIEPNKNIEDTTPEKLYADATTYSIKNTDLTAKKSKEIDEIANYEEENNKIKLDWENANKEVKVIEKKIAETQNEGDKKTLLKELENKKADASKLFSKFDKEKQQINFTEHNLYSDLIEEHRTNGNSKEEVQANTLLQQSDLYFEEANLLRNNKEKGNELSDKEKLQALDLEQISINKQKQALDIFAEVKPQIAENTTANQTPVLVLTSDDESDLKNYRKISYKADKQKEINEINLAKIEADKRKANKLFSKDKAKILEDLSKKEIESNKKLIASYKTLAVADSLKYNVYKKQLAEIASNNSIEKNNKLVANEYIKGADYFYAEAKNIIEQAENETDVIKKRKQLDKAHNLEKMALENQEIAVNTLLNKNEDSFISTGSLVKVEPLEKFDSKVDTSKVQEATYSKIIEQITITDEEIKQLDELVDFESEITKEQEDYKNIESDINFLKSDIEDEQDNKNKQKLQKKLEKKEAELLASNFAILDYKEKYNDTKFYVLYDNLKSNRKKGNSQEIMQARQLEKDAAKDYKRAKQLRDKSFVVASAEKALEYDKEAAKLEEKSISNITNAYGLYLNIDENEIKEQLADNNTEETNNLGIIKNTTADITPIEADTVETEITDSNITDNNIAQTDTLQKSDSTIAENVIENVDTNNIEKTLATNDTVVKPDIVENTDTISKNEIIADNSINNNKHNTDSNNNTSENSNTEDLADTTTTTTQTNNNEKNILNNENTIIKNVANNTNNENYAVYPVSVYTKTNPIPVNPELPTGIVFKVQIGAFKNSIRQNSFKGLSPIAAEKIPGSSYTRYLAGMFKSYEGVRTALSEIKTIGYKDAFIVAYRDGKRIPLYIARGEAKKNISNYDDVATNESASVKSRNKNAIDIASANTNNNEKSINSEGPIVVAKNIKKTDKLLYTVQIGVYKTEVPHSRLYNLSPIYEEKTPYGFIRYTTGIFSDKNTATTEKNRIRKIGIKDAFITAYYKGKKISLQEAESLKSKNVDTETDENVSLPQVKIDKPSTTNIDVTNLYYKVQIGAYKEQIPVNDVASWLSVARKQELKQFKDERGYTVFAVGNYKSYDEASRMKSILINEGVKDAFVVAYSGNKKISVAKAKEVLGK